VRDVVTVAVEQNVCENALFADLGIQEIDIDDVTFCDAVLSTASFDNCESHGCFLGKRGENSHGRAALASGKRSTGPSALIS
jgi:hypothetical protein